MSRDRTATTFAISGIRKERAYLSGEIQAAEAALAEKRMQLAALDTVLRLLGSGMSPDMIPAIRPVARGKYFSVGDQTRLCLEAIRDAGRPITAREASVYAMTVNGLDVDNDKLRNRLSKQARSTLYRLLARGVVRKVGDLADVRWELAA